jgi:hypothetical protein
MPKPSHVEAFEFVCEGNEIRDYIAFGVFMQSEEKWVAERGSSPTETEYKRYHENLLNNYERDRFRAAADDILLIILHKPST